MRSGSRDATSVTRSVFVDVSATTPPRTMQVAAPWTACCWLPPVAPEAAVVRPAFEQSFDSSEEIVPTSDAAFA